MSVNKKQEWVSIVLFCLGLVIILGSVGYFGIKALPAEMATGVIAGALIIAFGNLDKLKSFSGGGFSVELRNRVTEVEVNLDTLKELMIVLSNPILKETTWSGRFHSENLDIERWNMTNKIAKLMKKLKIKDLAFVKGIEEYHRILLRDHIVRLQRVVNKDIKDDELKKEIREIIESGLANPLDFDIERFSNVIEQSGHSNEQISDLVKDFQFFKKKKKFRRQLPEEG